MNSTTRDMIKTMNADYAIQKVAGNEKLADDIQSEASYATSYPALYGFEVSVREILNAPSAGMWSAMRVKASGKLDRAFQ